MTACLDCAQTFDARGDWQTRCWRCWREQRENDRYTAGYDEGWQRGYSAGLLDAPVSLDPGLVADLIALCHPDRHPAERADLAHRATVQLLGVREQIQISRKDAA